MIGALAFRSGHRMSGLFIMVTSRPRINARRTSNSWTGYRQMLKLPIFILLWFGFMLIKLPTALTGVLVVPFMWRYRTTHFIYLPWWTRPWANPEDWEGGEGSDYDSLPRWWIVSHGVEFKSWWHYHAIRNPANGLRSFESLDLDIDPDKVEYYTPHFFSVYEPHRLRNVGMRNAGYLAWQGWKAGMKYIHIWSDTRHAVIKLGWRVEPVDALNDGGGGIGIEDASFASKVLLYRKG